MNDEIKLSMQRKMLGGFINASDFKTEGMENQELLEELFDLRIHKAIARATVKLKEKEIPITEYTVLDFLQAHGMPSTIEEENEYLRVAGEWAITYESFHHYEGQLIKYKLGMRGI